MDQPEEKTIDISKIMAIMQKNFVVLTRDKTRLMPLILFPMFMILIFGYTTGNTPKHIPTALVAYEHSSASRTVQQAIQSNDAFAVRYMVSTEGEAKRLLDQGLIKAVIIIPPDLEAALDAGMPGKIMLIVDESDSAIASTVRQTVASITQSLSFRLGLGRIQAYQKSAASSSQKMQVYASSEVDMYGPIAKQVQPAIPILSHQESILSRQAEGLKASLPELSLLALPGQEGVLNENNTFFVKPIGYDATLAQIEFFTQAADLAGEANSYAAQAYAMSSRADALSKAHSSQFEELVAQPAEQISQFTESDPVNIIRPLSLSEKPAYGTGKRAIDFLIASIIALTIFQGAIMGMGRSVAGEKRDGSLTRVFLTPTSNITIIIGTLLFYSLFEVFRSVFLILLSILFFHIKIQGSFLAISIIIIIYAGVSTSIGMIISSIVKTEQQFMGMAMLVSMPTIFLAGVFFPLQSLPPVLQAIAGFLPITYAAAALNGVMIKGFSVGAVASQILILLVFLIAALVILFSVFKRDIE